MESCDTHRFSTYACPSGVFPENIDDKDVKEPSINFRNTCSDTLYAVRIRQIGLSLSIIKNQHNLTFD